MKIPFTTEQFLEVFSSYNLSIWPMQIPLYALALIAIYFMFRRSRFSDRLIYVMLAFLWLWMGLVYHIINFAAINPAARIFGGAFILQSLLFLYFGFTRRRMSFHFLPDIFGATGGALIIYALVLYPLLGYLLGHRYPQSPTFGAPCPTTIFTFGILLLGDRRIHWALLVVPVVWSVLGFSAAFSLGIREDIGLLIAGLLTLILSIFYNKIHHSHKAGHPEGRFTHEYYKNE